MWGGVALRGQQHLTIFRSIYASPKFSLPSIVSRRSQLTAKCDMSRALHPHGPPPRMSPMNRAVGLAVSVSTLVVDCTGLAISRVTLLGAGPLKTT